MNIDTCKVQLLISANILTSRQSLELIGLRNDFQRFIEFLWLLLAGVIKSLHKHKYMNGVNNGFRDNSNVKLWLAFT